MDLVFVKCSWFSLVTEVVFYKVAENSALTNIQLLFLKEILG
jgi:hypothetical protein